MEAPIWPRTVSALGTQANHVLVVCAPIRTPLVQVLTTLESRLLPCLCRFHAMRTSSFGLYLVSLRHTVSLRIKVAHVPVYPNMDGAG